MAETKRKQYGGRILISLIISTMLFIGVFTFGYYIAYSGLNKNSDDQGNLRDSFLELQLQKELISSSCENFNLEVFSKDLENMADYMITLEEKLGKNDPIVLNQKKTYSLIQIEHMLLVEEKIEKCNTNQEILIFFYSNEPEFIGNAEEVGYIITTFREKYDNVFVYSFDYDLDMTILETLKQINNVTIPNSVVYNSRYFEDLNNINDLISEKSTIRQVEDGVILLN